MADKKPQYGKFPYNATEEVEYIAKFGNFVKGDKEIVHPNTAILLRFKGVVKGGEAVKAKPQAKPEKAERKALEKPKVEAKKESPKKVVKKTAKKK